MICDMIYDIIRFSPLSDFQYDYDFQNHHHDLSLLDNLMHPMDKNVKLSSNSCDSIFVWIKILQFALYHLPHTSHHLVDTNRMHHIYADECEILDLGILTIDQIGRNKAGR